MAVLAVAVVGGGAAWFALGRNDGHSGAPVDTPGATQVGETTAIATSALTVAVSPSAAPTPTERQTQTPVETLAAEGSQLPEQAAPDIDGLEKKSDANGKVTYYALEGAQWGLKTGQVAGYFDPTVDVQPTSDSVVRTGGLELDAAIVDWLVNQQSDWKIPIGLDIGTDTVVRISFDDKGVGGLGASFTTRELISVPRMLVTFNRPCMLSSPVPQSYNNGYGLAFPQGDYGYAKWLFQSNGHVLKTTVPAGIAALDSLYMYSDTPFTDPYRTRAETDVQTPTPIGQYLGVVTQDVSISIGDFFNHNLTPSADRILTLKGVPVFIKTAPPK